MPNEDRLHAIYDREFNARHANSPDHSGRCSHGVSADDDCAICDADDGDDTAEESNQSPRQ